VDGENRGQNQYRVTVKETREECEGAVLCKQLKQILERLGERVRDPARREE